jgi:hypothetical protein
MWAFATGRVLDVSHKVLCLTEVDPLLRSETQTQLFLFGTCV